MPTPSPQIIANEMLQFLEATPLGADLEWTKDKNFLLHFEATRHLLVRKLLHEGGLRPEMQFRTLDVGYLHGLTQEFLHRAFPRSEITVFDRPASPIFSDETYMRAIKARGYLNLVAQNLEDLADQTIKYKVIVLGEVIEHIDPTKVATAFENLRKIVEPGGVLIITTPNAAGLYNSYMAMTDGDAIVIPPIPNPTMGYGHIHLWSSANLSRTAEYFGWKTNAVEFYHGREGEKFEKIRNSWGDLKSQIMIRAVRFLGNRYPKLKGFFVASFSPK